MELSAKYVYKIYTEKSFSAAAKALYISQPALSAAIGRLEKELGFKIFDRGTVPMTLTQEGKIYIDSILEIMESEATMKRRLRELYDMSHGSLSIGGSSQAAYHFLSVTCGEFHRRYPKIEVRLDIGNVGGIENLQEKIKKHTLDLIVGYVFPSNMYETIPLFEERFIIAMRKDFPGADKFSNYYLTRDEVISKNFPKEKEIEDAKVFSDFRFLKFSKNAHTTKKMAELIGDYKASQYTIDNVRHGGMHYNMMRSGLGAIMTTDTIIRMNPIGAEEIAFFALKSKASKRTLYIAKESGAMPNPIAEKFIEVATQICTSDALFKNY